MRCAAALGFLWATALAAAEPGVDLSIGKVSVNDRVLDGEDWHQAVDDPGSPLEVAVLRSLHLNIGQGGAGGAQPCRLRYMLEGVDRDWQDPPGRMHVSLQVVDENRQIIERRTEQVGGTSPGWTMKAESSFMGRHALALTAPARAAGLSVVFSTSDGADATLGIYAFRDVSVVVERVDGRRMVVRPPMDDSGQQGWIRGGTRTDMARTVQRLDGTRAMVLEDGDPGAFVWMQITGTLLPAIGPGDRVTLEWMACHSVGRGAEMPVGYDRQFAPGHYVFRLGARAVDGSILAQERRLYVQVLPPWWRRWSTWAVGWATVTTATVLWLRHRAWQRMQRRLREAERRTVVERERSRIARDIHDDLGAGMAQIAMLCGLARRAAPGSELQGARLQEIAARAEEGMRRLREIVWAVDPAYDGIEHLVVQLAANAEEHLQLAGIAFRAEIPPRLPESEFTAAVRHQLALAVREAVHNAVRHGRPGCVTLRVVPARRELVIEVIDDGCGCDADAALAAGRGVANLDRRLRALGGRCRFVSTPGSGTTVRFTVPIPDHARASHGHHPTRRPSSDHGGGGGGRSRPARRPPGLPG